MLEFLRDFSKTWIAKFLLAILIVSFGAFGIGNVVTQLGSTTVARVGNTDITAQDFDRAYQNQLNQIAQQTGQMPNSQQAMALGIPMQVVARLASDAAVDHLANTMGVSVSNAHLTDMLRNERAFQGPGGTFDKQMFQQAIQSAGYTDATFLAEEAKEARGNQITAALFGDAPIPQAALDIVNRYGEDTRSLNYVVLNSNSIPAIPAPTTADLTAYLKAHQSDYRTKETRTADLMLISPTLLAKGIAIPSAKLQVAYEKQKDQLTKVEKRHVEQVGLTADQVTAFEKGKAAGQSFDQLVKANGLTPADLGTLGKADITDSALADAAFGLKQGDFTIIPGISGQRAVTVTEIQPGGVETLAEATPQLTRQLAQQQAVNEIGDDVDAIEDLRAADKPLADIAPRYKLKIVPVTLTADGSALADVSDLLPADRDKVAQAIFRAKEGALTPSVSLSASGTLWFDLKKVVPARDETLAEVHDAIAKAWTDEKTNAAYKAAADKLLAALKSGKSFDEVAGTVNQFPTLSPPITRQGDTSGVAGKVLDRTVAAAAFAGGPNHAGYAVDGDGDYVIFQVAAVNPASGKLPAETQTAVRESVRDSVYGNFVNALTQTDGIRINQGAMQQALNLPSGG
jgi:peptidyl-prolyl cis-trans isomerase D